MKTIFPSDTNNLVETIKLFVPGIPKAQPRPRATRRGSYTGMYNPPSANTWKETIKLVFRRYSDIKISGPVKMEIIYHLPRPKNMMRKKDPDGLIRHIKKPDVDNLDKAVLDSLSDIGVWEDDRQVYDLHSIKYYCAKEGRPGAYITILEEN